MDEAQCRYATTEKELLAIVYAFEKFRSYLVGSKVSAHESRGSEVLADKERRQTTPAQMNPSTPGIRS